MPIIINEVISNFNEQPDEQDQNAASGTLFNQSADRVIQKILAEQQLRLSRKKRLKVD